MNSPDRVSEGCLEAAHHMKEKREINTAVFRLTAGVLVPEAEANWTHEEVIQHLPRTEPRLLLHELSFAAPDGARRHEQLLIFWAPPGTSAQEDVYTAAYSTLKDLLPEVRVHLTARSSEHLAHRRLVALAG
ncbi:hypothetical protein ACIGFK_16875 [Streptomyces sp. NPDC085524]|uniref:hypothetical protein n=1 Tax=unclassified Streptomyces TaxID=2593676 RepID=UPI0035D9A296